MMSTVVLLRDEQREPSRGGVNDEKVSGRESGWEVRLRDSEERQADETGD